MLSVKVDSPPGDAPAGGSGSRRDEAFQVRQEAARQQRQREYPAHTSNDDETSYPNRIGSYSKGLMHDARGEVEAASYDALLKALGSGKKQDFDDIPLGGTLKLANPRASWAYELQGADSHQLAMPPAPAFASAEAAGEMVELYWQALTRDVPFADYETDPVIRIAAAELSKLPGFRGPKADDRVTAKTIFRGPTAGERVGPYVSQFLLRTIPFGATDIPQRYRTVQAGRDYVVSYGEWLRIQNGGATRAREIYDPTPRYLRNGRDLGEYVHQDFSYQAFLGAALILLELGPEVADPRTPYLNSRNEGPFVTFGAPNILDFVAQAANAALRASWCQKWLVHRRGRPEAFAGRVHNHLTGTARYPLHASVLKSAAVQAVFDRQRTYLLPLAYAEGSPAHPSYPAGHAAIAGACVTMLKAFFNEEASFPNPQEATPDGLGLRPVDQAVSVGGELDKLAANVALGRDAAGLHWRSDSIEGLRLGETVAVHLLRDLRRMYAEEFDGFMVTRFDGERVRV